MNSTVIDRESTTAVLGVDFGEAFAAEAGCPQEYGSFIQINGQEVARIPERTRAFAHAQEGKYAHIECLSEAVLISTQSRRSKGRNAANAKNA